MIALLATTILLQASAPSQNSQNWHLPFQVKRDASYWKWRDLPWTTEDKAVTEARKKLDTLMDGGVASLPQIEKIALDARQRFESGAKPDPRPLTIWTYAAFRAQVIDPSSQDRTSYVKAINYLEKVAPIPSYEYARTRFLVLWDISPKETQPVAKRLIRKEPNDYIVSYYNVILLDSLDPKEARRACAELIRKWPNKPSGYALMGTFYYYAGLDSSNKDDFRTAKKYFEIYLQKNPPAGSSLDVVKRRLKTIEKKLSGG